MRYFFKKLYSFLLEILTKLFGIGFAKKIDTRIRFHKKLDLMNPKTLAEKVTYIELYNQSELAPSCTDKFEVRKYVASKGLEHILIPVVGGPWNCYKDIDFSTLPEKFALKATHGCKMNFLVEDKNKIDYKSCHREVNRWLKTTYGKFSIEPHYFKIPHRIYAEEYLGNMNTLIDYKFHCFDGKPEFVLAITGRECSGDASMHAVLDLYDMEWNPIYKVKKSNSEIPGIGNIAKPKLFEEMKKIAETLSKDFKFVRVDLYETNDKVLFGELTFSPACCIFNYFEDDFQIEMGKKLEI